MFLPVSYTQWNGTRAKNEWKAKTNRMELNFDKNNKDKNRSEVHKWK